MSLFCAMSIRLRAPHLIQQTTRWNSVISQGKVIDPSFGLNQDEIQLQKLAYDFGVKEMRPHMRQWDKEGTFPRDVMRKAASLGFGGLYVKSDDGGTGASRLESSLVFEALSQGCTSTAAYISIHNMCTWMVSTFGSQQLKDRFLPGLISMDTFSSYCLTEPDHGSDAGNITTTAVKKGDYYIVNGSKAFISGSYEDNIFLVMCRTGGSGPKGISCLVLDSREVAGHGFSLGKPEDKLGWKTHPARVISFEDVKVPVSNLVGQEGQGFTIAMKGLNGGRVNIASCSLGAAQWALEETIMYTNERKQFGQTISSFQNTQFELASIASLILSSRLMVRAAARANDEAPEEAAPFAAAAKLRATDDCYHSIDRCLQLFGGYGYLYDYPIQQLLRDTRVHRILEGTNEVMKVILARDLLSEK